MLNLQQISLVDLNTFFVGQTVQLLSQTLINAGEARECYKIVDNFIHVCKEVQKNDEDMPIFKTRRSLCVWSISYVACCWALCIVVKDQKPGIESCTYYCEEIWIKLHVPVLPISSIQQITRVMPDLMFTYRNTTTDIKAYKASGIPKERIYVIGPHGGKGGSVKIDNFTDHIPEIFEFPDADPPMPYTGEIFYKDWNLLESRLIDYIPLFIDCYHSFIWQNVITANILTYHLYCTNFSILQDWQPQSMLSRRRILSYDVAWAIFKLARCPLYWYYYSANFIILWRACRWRDWSSTVPVSQSLDFRSIYIRWRSVRITQHSIIYVHGNTLRCPSTCLCIRLKGQSSASSISKL